MNTHLILTLLATHTIWDFIMQSRWMGNNKSKELKPLLAHALTYSVGLVIWAGFAMNGVWSAQTMIYFIALNMVFHFITDFFTSKISRYYYETGQEGAFWNTIGIDQFIHAATLIYTLEHFTN